MRFAITLSLSLLCNFVATKDPPGPSTFNTLRLEMFYYDVTTNVSDVLNETFYNFDLDEVGAKCLEATLFHIQAEAIELGDFAKKRESDSCLPFDTYRKAIVLMEFVRSMRDAIAAIADKSSLFDKLDELYQAWATVCPIYKSVQSKEQRISLLYISAKMYLSRTTPADLNCCQARNSVDDWERNFFLKQLDNWKFVRYGDRVGVGYKDSFLSNEGENLNWWKSWVSDWEVWRVENFCRRDNYHTYGVVRMFDLIQFHSMDSDGHYFTFGTRTYTNGPYHYAVLPTDGEVPHFWKTK